MPRRENYKKRPATVKQYHADEALKLHLQNYSLREIASILNISYDTVRLDLNKVVARWKEANQETVQNTIMKSLATLDLVEHEAWKAWFRSCEDAEKHRVVKKLGDAIAKKVCNLVVDQDILEITGQCGDPRMLALVIRSAQAKAKLLEQLQLKSANNEIWEKILKELQRDLPELEEDAAADADSDEPAEDTGPDEDDDEPEFSD